VRKGRDARPQAKLRIRGGRDGQGCVEPWSTELAPALPGTASHPKADLPLHIPTPGVHEHAAGDQSSYTGPDFC